MSVGRGVAIAFKGLGNTELIVESNTYIRLFELHIYTNRNIGDRNDALNNQKQIMGLRTKQNDVF